MIMDPMIKLQIVLDELGSNWSLPRLSDHWPDHADQNGDDEEAYNDLAGENRPNDVRTAIVSSWRMREEREREGNSLEK